MAGNATQAAIAAANLKLTGVGSPDTAVKGITDGLAAIQTHLDANETARQKLITDTNEYQKKIQEDGAAASLASNNTTIDNAILKSTESFVSGAADKSKLVSMGLVKMTDFNIYTQNGKSSYEILSKQLANMEAEYDLTIKRSQGYVNDKGAFVEPESGIGEDFLQKWQTSVARLGNTDMVAGEDGMGKLIVYETEVKNGVVVSRRDSNGDKIVDKDASSSILALQRDENKRSNKIYLNKRAQTAVGKGSGLGSYMSTLPKDAGGLLLGSLEDNWRKNPLIKSLLEVEINQINVTDSDMLSVLGDNISSDMQVIKGKLTDAQKNDKSVTITVTDPETGTSTTRQISKYVGAKMTSENVWAFQLSEDQQKAAKEATMTVLWGSLEKTYKPGTKRTVFQKIKATGKETEEKNTFKLITESVKGNYNSLQSLVDSIDSISAFKPVGNTIVFTRADGSDLNPIDISGTAVNAGKRIAAQLGLNAEGYANKSGLSQSESVSIKVGKFNPYAVTSATRVIDKKGYTTSIEKSFFPMDGNVPISKVERTSNVKAKLSVMMSDLGVSGELKVSEIIETPGGEDSGGVITIDGEEIGTLTDASTLDATVSSIIGLSQKAGNASKYNKKEDPFWV